MTGKRRKGKERFAGFLRVLLLAGLLAAVSGCGKSDPSADRSADESAVDNHGEDQADMEVNGRTPNGEAQDGPGAAMTDAEKQGAAAVTDFGLRLLQQCVGDTGTVSAAEQEAADREGQQETENPVVSPLSVLSALNMAAYGAEGETLKQMEEAFGITVPELSAYLSARGGAWGDGKCRLNMANGIWFTEDESFTVEEDFLKACASLFDAEVRRVPFQDKTLQEINDWVKEKTQGMIPEILDRIWPEAVMYLVNALAFEGEWEEIYREDQVREGEFTRADGTVQQVEMMYSQENQYLQDEHASGFLKYYAGRKYAYAALLPEEGMDAAEYLLSLDGERLCRILANPVEIHVQAWIPRYESSYSAELGDILQNMGIRDGFDSSRADFSGIGYSANGNIFISRVLHKSYIAVDEKGTKAGAATAVVMEGSGAMMEDEIRFVYLDRPFVYMIIDCESGVPVFMGILNQAGREE